MNDTTNEIKRLKFEELLWIIYSCLLNVYGVDLGQVFRHIF